MFYVSINNARDCIIVKIWFFVASTTADIGGRLRKDSCYKIVDGPFKNDKYFWYQLTHRCWNEVRCIL